MKKIQLPEQPDDIDEKRQAWAPYNFVPLPDQIVTQKVTDLPDQGIYDKNRLTGYIDCELTTESPIYIRAGVNRKQIEEGKQSKDIPDFFYLNDANEPVIPGSSLRDMIRTLVEIVTYSKVSFVSNKRYVFRSVGDTTTHGNNYRSLLVHFDGEFDVKIGSKNKKSKHYTPLIKAGYIVKNETNDWAICPAKEIGGTTYAYLPINDKFEDFYSSLKSWKGYHAARQIFIQVGKYEYQPVKGGSLHVKFAKASKASKQEMPDFIPAVLLRSGHIDKKKSEAVIFEKNEKTKLLPLSDDLVDIYIEQLRQSKEQVEVLEGEKADQTSANGVLKPNHPVFYLTDGKTGDVIFFGHTRMFRVPYPYSTNDFLPKELREAKSLSEVDFAESIFGYTREQGKGKERAFAGRVSFTDGVLMPDQKNIWLSSERTIIPKILSGPKPTTFQHYLVQENLDPAQLPGRKEPRYKLADYFNKGTVIRGHKFYWHKGAVSVNDIKEADEIKKGDKQHTKINPLRAGIQFNFRIKFENLTQDELGSLLYVVRELAGSNATRIELGMGKPLGMGSVKVTPHTFIKETSKRYDSLFGKNAWATGFEENDKIQEDSITTFLVRMKNELGASLDDADRINQLKIILKWTGIIPDEDGKPTRYMDIKRKEYRDRPVLPPASYIFGAWNKNAKKEKTK